MNIQTIEITKAIRPLAEYVHQVNDHITIVTVDGNPIAAVVAMDEKDWDWESWSLSQNPQFLAILERSRESQKIGKGLTSDEVRACLGLNF
jgi:antitoxin (DNA-binding transcriptional repressor) of toxin-antitoxin stability system